VFIEMKLMRNTKYRSTAMVAIHETMKDLRKISAINERTLHRFEEARLTSCHRNRLNRILDREDGARTLSTITPNARGR
jgi:hypothetical protein